MACDLLGLIVGGPLVSQVKAGVNFPKVGGKSEFRSHRMSLIRVSQFGGDFGISAGSVL